MVPVHWGSALLSGCGGRSSAGTLWRPHWSTPQEQLWVPFDPTRDDAEMQNQYPLAGHFGQAPPRHPHRLGGVGGACETRRLAWQDPLRSARAPRGRCVQAKPAVEERGQAVRTPAEDHPDLLLQMQSYPPRRRGGGGKLATLEFRKFWMSMDSAWKPTCGPSCPKTSRTSVTRGMYSSAVL